MRCHVIGEVPGDLIAVQRDRTGANWASTVFGVRSILRISGKVPQKHIPGPVRSGADHDACHWLCYPQLRCATMWKYQLLREEDVLTRKGCVHGRQSGDL